MSDVHAADLTQQTIETARRWWTVASTMPTDPSAARLVGLLRDPDGLEFARGLADRVVRPDDDHVAAANLDRLSRRTPALLPWHLRAAISFGGGFGPLAPKPIIPVVRRALRHVVGHLVVDASPDKLGQALAGLRSDTVRLDVSALGGRVSSDAEADRRLAATRALIDRPDVDRVSTTVRSLIGPTSDWSFDEASAQAVERLGPLFEAAAATEPPTVLTLGVERYRDVDLTIDVFTRLLDQPHLLGTTAGIVVQSYLTDALSSLQLLTEWSRSRVDRGGVPIEVRVVKGCARADEEAEARLQGWPLATYATKTDTDANHKRLLDFALRPENAAVARVGVAGHNLFDVAHAVTLAGQRGTAHAMQVEMMLGVVPSLAAAVAADVGGIVLAAPVVDPSDFDSATGYLVRRLDEHADPEGFLSSVLDVDADAAFDRERRRYVASIEAAVDLPSGPGRVQDRSAPAGVPSGQIDDSGPVDREPDTDPSLERNRRWARQVLTTARRTGGARAAVDRPRMTDPSALEAAVARSARAGATWGHEDASTRAELLDIVTGEIAQWRAALIEVLVDEHGLTLLEADHDVSSAVDVARRYASLAREVETLVSATPVAPQLTLVAPGQSSPVVGTIERVLGALAAGSAVLVMPPAGSYRSIALTLEVLWSAGVTESLLTVVDVDHDPALVRSVVCHTAVHRVDVDRSFETAALFRSWRPDLAISSRVPGVTSIVVTPSADLEAAATDVVTSAFSAAGRADAAASLVIAVGSVGESEAFRRLLRDGAASVKVGPADEVSTVMGPLGAPAAEGALEALTVLGAAETWLVEPRSLDDEGRLWSPGIRLGVRPESAFASTRPGAPVLGVVAVDSLAEAIELQNRPGGVERAGLQSLDVDEVDDWLHAVRAGSLVVNRPTTGVVVGRQPVGGWGRASVGTVGALGGSNAVVSRLGWARVAHEPRPSLRLHDVSEPVTRVVEAARPNLSFEQFDVVRTAVESDQRAWLAEFGVSRDESALVVERNVRRYRPHPVTIRLAAGSDVADLVRLVAAGTRVGSTLTISSAVPVPAGLAQVVRAPSSPVRVRDVVVETDAAFLARASAGALQGPVGPGDGPDVLDLLARAAGADQPTAEEARVDDSRPPASRDAVASYRGLRVRLIGGDPRALAQAVWGSPDVTVYSGDVTEEGRVELLAFVREQSVSITTLRLGAVDSALSGLRV